MNLTGQLIRIGTDETGLCRAIVQLNPEELKAMEHVPMYQTVELVPVLLHSPLGTQQLACGNRVAVENPTTIRVE